jgi:hypothetical protein
MIDFVTVRCGLAANRPQDENNINPVAIVRIVATAKSQDGLHFGCDSRFFLYFPNYSLLDSFIRLNETSRQLPVALPVTRRAPYEQQLPTLDYRTANADVVA